MNNDFDCKLAGVVMALLCGMDRGATERVSEALEVFAEDRNTPPSEAAFYRDLASCIMPMRLPIGGLFESLETLH
jgi:hypothetical protein